ncbi:hemolysin-III related-domain-containing protein [Mycena amicta]|nr:hemolysin-III related-domain-containing protein [Mycena amicta]
MSFAARRRMSAPTPRSSPPRLPACRPLSHLLEALDLPTGSPTQALASLRFVVLSCLADLEKRLSDLEERAGALEMLHAIRDEVRSHLPDTHFTLPQIDIKSIVAGFDLSKPLSYFAHEGLAFDLPILADVLDTFQADVDAFLGLSLPSALSRASKLESTEEDPEVSRALVVSDNGWRLLDLDDLPLRWHNNPFVLGGYRFIPLSNWPALLLSVLRLHNDTLNIQTHLIPLVLWIASFGGLWTAPGQNSLVDRVIATLSIGFTPFTWVLPGFITHDIARYTPFSAYTAASNSSAPLPWTLLSAPYPPVSPHVPPDATEIYFSIFALGCLLGSVIWHTMAGCAHYKSMETCARLDYVGIGWLSAGSVSSVVHHGFMCAEIALDATPLGHKILHPSQMLLKHIAPTSGASKDPSSFLLGSLSSTLLGLTWLFSAASDAINALLGYHPWGSICLVLCFVCGLSANYLAFCDWFNGPDYRSFRVWFFLGISLSGFAPLLGVAALQGWGSMVNFVAPVIPSLVFYLIGMAIYGSRFPECFLGTDRKKRWRITKFLVDDCGAGSHAIWHVIIYCAMRAHRDGLREMARVAAAGGCAARTPIGWP